MIGFTGQIATVNSTPQAIAPNGQKINTGIRLRSLVPSTNTDVIYFGFFKDAASALAGLTTSTGFPIAPATEEPVDGGAIRQFPTDGCGDLQYLFVACFSNTVSLAYWGV